MTKMQRTNAELADFVGRIAKSHEVAEAGQRKTAIREGLKSAAAAAVDANNNASSRIQNAPNQVKGSHIISNAILAGHIAAGQVLSGHIGLGQVQNGHIGIGQVFSNHIANQNVGTQHYYPGSVSTPHLAYGAVYGGIIPNGAIQYQHIANGHILTQHIGNYQLAAGHMQLAYLNGISTQWCLRTIDGQAGSAQPYCSTPFMHRPKSQRWAMLASRRGLKELKAPEHKLSEENFGRLAQKVEALEENLMNALTLLMDYRHMSGDERERWIDEGSEEAITYMRAVGVDEYRS